MTDTELPTETPPASKIDDQFSGLINTLSTFRTQITALSAQLRTLEKSVKREIKQHKKDAAKRKNRGKRQPSGFAKATNISDELCEFMSHEHGTQVARTDVTKYIIAYIKDNNLQKQENRKIIEPDDALKKLLTPDEGEEVTYFNLQRFMNKHFISSKQTEKSS